MTCKKLRKIVKETSEKVKRAKRRREEEKEKRRQWIAEEIERVIQEKRGYR